MEAARSGTRASDGRFDGLRAEATAAVVSSANILRAVLERYRAAYAELLQGTPTARPFEATEDLDDRQDELSRLDLAQRTLLRTQALLEGEGLPDQDRARPVSRDELAVRILEAQEAERALLAQEIHDGPAQALTNAIFQVDYIERVLRSDPAGVDSELRFLRDQLRRELADMRAFISQLRPPMLEALGLDGALMDAVERIRALTGLSVATDLSASAELLDDSAQTVVLRVAQEALQNIHKHAAATTIRISTRVVEHRWVLEVGDDGHGFDPAAVATRGRRNFGLTFMRERAELIGARVDVRSQPDGGTVVRLVIPLDTAREQEEST